MSDFSKSLTLPNDHTNLHLLALQQRYHSQRRRSEGNTFLSPCQANLSRWEWKECACGKKTKTQYVPCLWQVCSVVDSPTPLYSMPPPTHPIREHCMVICLSHIKGQYAALYSFRTRLRYMHEVILTSRYFNGDSNVLQCPLLDH